MNHTDFVMHRHKMTEKEHSQSLSVYMQVIFSVCLLHLALSLDSGYLTQSISRGSCWLPFDRCIPTISLFRTIFRLRCGSLYYLCLFLMSLNVNFARMRFQKKQFLWARQVIVAWRPLHLIENEKCCHTVPIMLFVCLFVYVHNQNKEKKILVFHNNKNPNRNGIANGNGSGKENSRFDLIWNSEMEFVACVADC